MASCFCEICDRWLAHPMALHQHLRDSIVRHPRCKVCDATFESLRALKSHYDREHYFSCGCGEVFDDEDDLFDHGESDHFVCAPCRRIFMTFDALANHNDAKHYYCRECDRLFRSPSNLDAHRRSHIHTPRSFQCPSRYCERAFVSMSALILHAESGTCASGLTRETVNARMAIIDCNNVITTPNYWAPTKSWNGSGYECSLCGAEFRKLHSLNQHLKSPRHPQPPYQCPEQDCALQFDLLSALSQHVESGSCGARETGCVEELLNALTQDMEDML